MGRLAARSFAALLLCLLLGGCWDRVELNELGITSATSLDRIGEDWILSYQVIIPSAISSVSGNEGGGVSPITVHSTKAKTIREAVAKSKLESPRQLYFAHNRVLVVSERAAREGLSSIIDVYFRLPNSRETVSMLISKDNPARVLRQLMSIQRISGQGIQQIVANESKSGSLLPNIRLYEFAMNIVGDSRSGIIPEIVVSGSPDVDKVDQMGETRQSSRLKLGRLAVFKADRMQGWFSQKESFGVAFFNDRVKVATLSFACGDSSNGQRIDSTFTIKRSSTRLTPKYSNGKMQMDVHVKSAGVLEETECTDDLQDPRVIKRMENNVRDVITGIMQAAREASKRQQLDVLGFAQHVHRKYPRYWKEHEANWDREFAKLEMKLTVEVRLERLGVSNKSFKSLEDPEGG